MSIKIVDLNDLDTKKNQGFQRVHIFNYLNTRDNKISLEYVILPTGAESVPHLHIDTHTVVFTIRGGVKIYYGDTLENHLYVRPQQSVYIPPNIIHHVVNEDDDEMVAVVARTPSVNSVKEFKHLLELI